jgi:hypothetical protein
MSVFTESTVEDAGPAWLAGIGWQVAPDMPAAERRDQGEAALADGRPPD